MQKGRSMLRPYIYTSNQTSAPNQIITVTDPLVGGQCVQAHWAAGVQFLGADGHFCAQAKLAAVGEAGAGVDVHRAGVHRTHKVLGAAQ